MSQKVKRDIDARKITSYPKPKYLELTNAYAKVNEIPKSEAVCYMIKAFFDSMPEPDRARLIHQASGNHY